VRSKFSQSSTSICHRNESFRLVKPPFDTFQGQSGNMKLWSDSHGIRRHNRDDYAALHDSDGSKTSGANETEASHSVIRNLDTNRADLESGF